MATLYTWAGNTNAAAVQAAAAISGQDVKVADFVPGTAPAGFPAYASAPVLTTSDGQNLTQLSAILSAVSGDLSPAVLEQISFAENVITPAAAAWTFPTLGAMPNNKGAIAEGKKSLLAALDSLNTTLSTKTFLAGERASAADAAVAASLSLAFKQVLAPEYRKDIPHVVRWFQTCVNQASFKAFGAHTLCEKEAQFDGKTFGELNKKGGNQAKAGKQQQPAKKEEPKKKKKPLIMIEEPKKEAKVDPWAGLGGDYDFDAWKRMYSNNPASEYMPYFWEKLDKENYSVYFGKYKYGDEIALPFMASNLIRGMFQRIDKMRKNSFASVCVFGGKEPKDIEISGVWFWKGTGLAFELCKDWNTDYDTYDWTKMDTDCPEVRKQVEEYFTATFAEKPFYEAKCWK